MAGVGARAGHRRSYTSTRPTDVLELADRIGFSSYHMLRGPRRWRRLLATRIGGGEDVLRHCRHDTATAPSC